MSDKLGCPSHSLLIFIPCNKLFGPFSTTYDLKHVSFYISRREASRTVLRIYWYLFCGRVEEEVREITSSSSKRRGWSRWRTWRTAFSHRSSTRRPGKKQQTAAGGEDETNGGHEEQHSLTGPRPGGQVRNSKQQQEERMKQMEDMKNSILSQVLDQEAR